MKRPTPERNLFQSILCPVDFSAHSGAALQHAAALAQRSQGRLTVLFVNDPLLAAAAEASQRTLARTTAAALQTFVTKAIERTSGPVAYVVAQGDPATEITERARRAGADLIVLGTQGLSGVSRWFFGSTTERVLRQAAVPVLAVPRRRGRALLPHAWAGARVLAALELGQHTMADARAAALVATWLEADLTLAHVVRPTHAPAWLKRHLPKRDRAALVAARARLDQTAKDLSPALHVDCRVQTGDAAEQVAALAADTGSVLVIVTLRARRGFLATPQGTTTYRVLGGAGTPVLALPSRWHPSRQGSAT
jgi:nucleotide-binding universal stress UspA family protein